MRLGEHRGLLKRRWKTVLPTNSAEDPKLGTFPFNLEGSFSHVLCLHLGFSVSVVEQQEPVRQNSQIESGRKVVAPPSLGRFHTSCWPSGRTAGPLKSPDSPQLNLDGSSLPGQRTPSWQFHRFLPVNWILRAATVPNASARITPRSKSLSYRRIEWNEGLRRDRMSGSEKAPGYPVG